MNRRLVLVLLALLPLWWGAFPAQAGELDDYTARGRALSKEGKLDQALPYFLLSLELAEIRFGLDHADLVPMIDDLAGAQVARENYQDAEPLYERALEIQEREAARHQTGIVRTLNKLGRIYEATDRAPEALNLYRRVITKWAPVLGGDHPDVRIAGGRLAKLALEAPGDALAGDEAAARAPKKVAKQESKAVPVLPKPVPKPRRTVAEPPAVAADPTKKIAKIQPRKLAGFSVHLTSIRDPKDARAEWDRLRRVFGGLLKGLKLRVAKADLGPKRGIYYRIKGGLLARKDARARCADFAARGVWCDVKGPEGADAPPLLATDGDTASNKLAPPADIGQTPPTRASLDPGFGYRVHLTSIRNARDAEREWRRLRRHYADLLGGLTLKVVRADLGPGKGIFYRVQGGTLSRQDARALCAQFLARDIWCRVVRPGEEAAESSLRVALQRGRRLPPSRHPGTRRRGGLRDSRIRRRDRGCRRSPFT